MAPRLARWPFFIGAGLLLSLAGFFCFPGQLPMGGWEIVAAVLCVAFGAALGAIPYWVEYRSALKRQEAEGLVAVVAQLKNLEQLAAQIGYANSQWQVVRAAADKTASAAKGIAQGIAAEASSFKEFMQNANEGEKAALRLEVEKLRRAEREWLQVVVRILDHVYALHQAALRSEQPGVAAQLGKFQLACHDAARRIGLSPLVAAPQEVFDEQRHELLEDDDQAPPGAVVTETIASGYTFQGQLVRPALVKVQAAGPRKGSDTASDENRLVRSLPDSSAG